MRKYLFYKNLQQINQYSVFLIKIFKFSSRNLGFHLIFLKNEAIYATLHPFTSNVGCNVFQNIVLTYIAI